MTTLIGIKTNFGLESIVLVGDYQITSTDKEEKEISKRAERKLHYGENWVMGAAGVYRRELTKFFGIIKGYKNYNSNPERANEIIEKAIKEKEFEEILQLNKKLRRRGLDMEDIPAFILAVNKPKLFLWWVDEYGNIKNPEEDNEFDYVCLGSGEERADRYIQSLIEEQKIDRDKIGIREALKIARDSMYAAERDPGTGMGYDIIVVTEKEIRSWGEEIKEEIRKAEEKKIEDIGDYYSHKKETT